MSKESSAHKALKVIAVKKLREYGFEPDEIKEELAVKADNRIYVVDVAGISSDERIAVECGTIVEPKLKRFFELQKQFDKIWHIKYSEKGEPYIFKEIEEILKDELEPSFDAWKSVKIKESTYKDLQDMGQGIGKAVDILVSAKKEAVSKKMDDVAGVSAELAEIMLASGMFDIKFKNSGIESIDLEDDSVTIHGFITVGITDKNAREEVYRVLSDGLERKA